MKYLTMKVDQVRGQSTAAVLTTCVNGPTKNGLSVGEMRSRIRLLDAIDNAGPVLALEDAEASVLKACFDAMKWSVVDLGIVDLADALAGMPSAEPVLGPNGAEAGESAEAMA